MSLTNTVDGTESSFSLDDRPWELFEYMHPLPSARKHGQEFLALKAYQDTASIPVAFFDPLIMRDALPGAPQTTDIDGELKWEDLASERNLGNGLAGEPLAVRQAATQMFAGPPKEDDTPDQLQQSNLLLSSPATSVSALSHGPVRRMSTRIASATSARNQLGTNRDPISIDDDDDDDEGSADGDGDGGAGDGDGDGDDDSSDDSDDLEDAKPLAKRPRLSGKSVSAGKRPTTGGKAPAKAPSKAPARQTVGGKNVGGKNVARKSSGKTISRKR